VNEKFRALSDLVADAEDLVARVSKSEDPRVRALADLVAGSVSSMRGRFREEVRQLHDAAAPPNPLWIAMAVGAAIGVGIWLCTRGRSRAALG